MNFEDQDDLIMIDVTSFLSLSELDVEFFNSKHLIGNNDILEKYVYTSSDVVVVGYPQGFIDGYNKFPIFKHGIISTMWKSLYEGNNEFLIDCNLFPASSGSLVVTKPTNVVLNNIAVMSSSEVPEFAILGIYSGKEKAIIDDQEEDVGMGAVVYSSRMLVLMSKGVLLQDFID